MTVITLCVCVCVCLSLCLALEWSVQFLIDRDKGTAWHIKFASFCVHVDRVSNALNTAMMHPIPSNLHVACSMEWDA